MIFLDSSFIIACKVIDDEHHNKSMDYLNKLIENNEQAIITDYIFDEVVTVLLLKTKNLDIAADTGNTLINSSIILKTDEHNFKNAWDIFKSQKDTYLSFTDCSTIAVMKKQNIINIATYDKEFMKVKDVKVVC